MKRALGWMIFGVVLVGCAQNTEPFQQQNQQQAQQQNPPTEVHENVWLFWNGHFYPSGQMTRLVSSELIEAAKTGDVSKFEVVLQDAAKTFAGVDDPARGGDAVGAEADVGDERFASASSVTTVPSATHSQSLVFNIFNTSDASVAGDQQGEASQSTTADQTIKAAVEAAVSAALGQTQTTQSGSGEGAASATGGAMTLDQVLDFIKTNPDVAPQIVEAVKQVATKEKAAEIPPATVAPG